MRKIIIFLPLIISACSFSAKTQMDINAEPELSVYRQRNLGRFKIDSSLRQLGYEYNQANRAISANNAEKVYIERYAKGLQDKRRRTCTALLNKESCKQ